MKYTKKIIPQIILALVILLGVSLNISIVHAQTPSTPCQSSNTNYCLLAPLPGLQVSPNGGIDTTLGVESYINTLIKILIGLMSVLAVIMIVVGGIQYMVSSSGGEKQGGKDRITNALMGLVLALSAYLILNTINPHLVNLHVGVPAASLTEYKDVDSADLTKTRLALKDASGNWVDAGDVLCDLTTSGQNRPMRGQLGVTVRYPDNNTTENATMVVKDGGPWPNDDGSDLSLSYTDTANAFPTLLRPNLAVTIVGSSYNYRSILAAAGITVNSSGTNIRVGQTGVTSLYGMPQATLDGLAALKTSCDAFEGKPCDIVVTGGTECWAHNTHEPGQPAVDLRKTPTLSDYLLKKAGIPIATDNVTYTLGTASILNENSSALSTGAHVHINHF